MATLLLLARCTLALVFLVASGAKLADPAGTRDAMRDFGVSPRLVSLLAATIPIGELAVAVALILPFAVWWGALGALLLLLLFIVAISVTLVRGRRPACHCFGQLSAQPVGWTTLVRNGALGLGAGVVVSQGPEQPGTASLHWVDQLTTTERTALLGGVILLCLVAGEGWLLFQVRSQNERLRTRFDAIETRLAMGALGPVVPDTPPPIVVGLPVGASAPAFALPDLNGDIVTLDGLRAAHRPILLIFTDPDCAACAMLLPQIRQWHDHAALTLVLMSRGSVAANRAKLIAQGGTRVLLQEDHTLMDAYQVHATPTAVLVHVDGTIGGPAAVGGDAIRQLVEREVATLTPPVSWLPDVRPRKRDGVHDLLRDDGRMILSHPQRTQTMTLNPTAAFVWECCDGEHHLAEITDEVRALFPDAPEVDDDIRTLLQELYENGMIVVADTPMNLL